MKELISLRPKMYSYRVEESEPKKMEGHKEVCSEENNKFRTLQKMLARRKKHS